MSSHTLRRVLGCALLLALTSRAGAQEAEPGGVDIEELLARVPADSPALTSDLLRLTAEDIGALCARLHEPGQGGDAAARYVLQGLALAVGAPDAATARSAFHRAISQVYRARWLRDPAFVLELLRISGDPEIRLTLRHGLDNPERCAVAARALASIGGLEAAQVLDLAYDRAEGDCRVAILLALAEVGQTSRLAQVRAHATSADPALRDAALHLLAALGHEGCEPLLWQRLVEASGTARGTARGDYTRLLREAARRGAGQFVVRVARERLASAGDQDVALRCALWSLLADALDAGGVPDLVAALPHEPVEVRAALLDLLVDRPGALAAEMLVDELHSAAPPTAALLLDVLARRGQPQVLDAVLAQLTDGADEAARAAAPAAATLGGVRAVPALVRALGRADAGVQQAAQDALARLRGPEVLSELLDALQNASGATRTALLHTLSRRNPPADAALLERVRTTIAPDLRAPEAARRGAAAAALGAVGGESVLPELLAAAVAAADEDSRTALGDALVRIAQRCRDRGRPVAAIIAAMSGQSPELRAMYLEVLGRLGGSAAFDAVRAAINAPEPQVHEAGLRALGAWPDAEPAEYALQLATAATEPRFQVLALRAYIRMIGLVPQRPAEQTAAMARRALGAAQRPEEKRLALAALGKSAPAESLAVLAALYGDRDIGADAAAAALQIVERLLPGGWRETREALDGLRATSLSPESRARADELFGRQQVYEDHITDWWLAGSWELPGKPGVELVGVPFPPEEPGAAVDWQRLAPRADDPDAGWRVNLSATRFQGDNRAIYLFTRVQAAAELPAQLELGSDDSIEAWLNGVRVHQHATFRGLEPAQDKIPVTLRAGENTLMLKVINDSGGWAASARFRAADGGRLTGVTAAAGERP